MNVIHYRYQYPSRNQPRYVVHAVQPLKFVVCKIHHLIGNQYVRMCVYSGPQAPAMKKSCEMMPQSLYFIERCILFGVSFKRGSTAYVYIYIYVRMYVYTYIYICICYRIWRIDHIIMREINRISMLMFM